MRTISESFEFQDGEGYTFRIDVAGDWSPFQADITQAPPGWANPVMTRNVSATLTNTTPGRELPYGLAQGAVYGVYNAESTCAHLSNYGPPCRMALTFMTALGPVPPSGSLTLDDVGSDVLTHVEFPEDSEFFEEVNRPDGVYFVHQSLSSLDIDLVGGELPNVCLNRRAPWNALWIPVNGSPPLSSCDRW